MVRHIFICTSLIEHSPSAADRLVMNHPCSLSHPAICHVIHTTDVRRGGAVSRMFTRAPSLARSNRGSEAAPGHAQLIAGALRTSVGSGSGEL